MQYREETRPSALRVRAVAVLWCLGVFAALLGVAPASAQGAGDTITVSEGESIQAALDNAAEGSTIIVEAGVYVEQVRVRTDGITLKGEKGATIAPGAAESANDCSWFGFGAAVCVATDFVEGANRRFPGQPGPIETINGVTVTGFTIEGPTGFGIWATHARDLSITRNDVSGTVAAGISLGVVEGFTVSRNSIDNEGGANFTPLFFVGASKDGKVVRNEITNSALNALTMESSRNVVVNRNVVEGNCGGLFLADTDQTGLRKIKITNNTIRGNNRTCTDPSVEGAIGGYGILAIAGSKLVIRGNEVVDNVVAEQTITPGAVIVGPTPGATNKLKNVVIAKNTLSGNSVGGVSLDLFIDVASKLKVVKNSCTVSVPDAEWCAG